LPTDLDEFICAPVKVLGPNCIVVHEAEQHALPRGKPWPRLAGLPHPGRESAPLVGRNHRVRD
jgi:hypothetical protein